MGSGVGPLAGAFRPFRLTGPFAKLPTRVKKGPGPYCHFPRKVAEQVETQKSGKHLFSGAFRFLNRKGKEINRPSCPPVQ